MVRTMGYVDLIWRGSRCRQASLDLLTPERAEAEDSSTRIGAALVTRLRNISRGSLNPPPSFFLVLFHQDFRQPDLCRLGPLDYRRTQRGCLWLVLSTLTVQRLVKSEASGPFEKFFDIVGD
jgi:hypothetical protein